MLFILLKKILKAIADAVVMLKVIVVIQKIVVPSVKL